MARWGYALYGGQVLTPDSVAQLTDFDPDFGPGYGLATVDFTQPFFRWGLQGYGVPGGTVGYRTVLAVYPEHHLTIAILTPSTTDVLPYIRHLVNTGRLIQ